METNLIFTKWRARCSSLGHLMTNLETITSSQLDELKKLQERKEESKTNPKLKLTDNMENKLLDLIAKRDKEDELPTGAKSHLDDVFRSQFWRRRRFLHNKFLEKGNLMEDDALGLLSKIDGKRYFKNDEQFQNEYIQGCPDLITALKVHDTKANYDLKSFDDAELTTLYDWQLKGYCWLTEKKDAELDYCLVNAPLSHVLNEKTRLFYAMGCPDEDNENWIDILQQMERNLIFDIPAFQKENPNYQFHNTILDFTIPAQFRVKKFQTELTPSDIVNIKSRVTLARMYLVQKEIEVYERMKS